MRANGELAGQQPPHGTEMSPDRARRSRGALGVVFVGNTEEAAVERALHRLAL